MCSRCGDALRGFHLDSVIKMPILIAGQISNNYSEYSEFVNEFLIQKL